MYQYEWSVFKYEVIFWSYGLLQTSDIENVLVSENCFLEAN